MIIFKEKKFPFYVTEVKWKSGLVAQWVAEGRGFAADHTLI